MSPRTFWIAIGASLLVLTLAFVAVWFAGEHHGATNAKLAALHVHEGEMRDSAAAHRRVSDSLALFQDSLHHVTAALDSVRHAKARETATAITAASLTRSAATLDSGSVTIRTDSGPATYTIPRPVAAQWIAERAADNRALAAATAQIAAESEAMASRDTELATGAQRDSARDALEASYRAEIADADAQVRLLTTERSPRFTFTEGAVAGGLLALAAKALVVAFF